MSCFEPQLVWLRWSGTVLQGEGSPVLLAVQVHA